MEFTIKVEFNVSAKTIYELWLNSEGHSKMTGSEARITGVVGDSFSAWDEYIYGVNLRLEPYKRIVQSWRTSDFDRSDEDSLVDIELKVVNGGTQLILSHTNLPDDGERYKKGWHDFYFEPMKEYFKSGLFTHTSKLQ